MSMETLIHNPIFVDGLFVLIFLFFVFWKGKKGLYKSLLPFIVLILSAVLAWSFAKSAAPIVSQYIYSSVEDKALSSIDYDKIDSRAAESVMNTVTEALPINLGQLFQKYVGEEKIQEMTSQIMESLGLHKNIKDMAKETAQNLFFTTFNSFIQIILFLILWLVLDIVLKFFGRMISMLFNTPGIRGVNHFGGAIIGALEFAVILWILVKILDAREVTLIRDMAKGTKLLSYLLAYF